MKLPERKRNRTDPSFPSYDEMRKRNHEVMIPDRGFTKELKILDPELDVVWDWAGEKWEIWKFPKGEDPYHITTVQTRGRTYRELGADVLVSLQMSIQFGPDKILDYLEEHNNQLRRRRLETFRNELRGITLDSWGPLFGLQSQVPKKYEIKVPLERKIAGVV